MTKLLANYQDSEHVDSFALIKSADVRLTKNGKTYIGLVFSDRSGDLPGNLWDATEEQITRFVPGKIVKLQGVRGSYHDQPQVQITNVRLTESGEPENPSDFMVHAPIKEADMNDALNDYILLIVNPTWNRLVRRLFTQYHDAFLRYPAAKSNHHAFAGGLAFHSLSIAKLAKGVAGQYPQLNQELLIAGALLHDLGKTIELSGPVATQYTLSGNLIGHITLIDEQIVLAARELKFDLQDEDLILLRHVVLSHHGILEYGSPVRPVVMEAEVLHQLDELDAGIQMMSGVLEKTADGSFSDRVFGLDNRKFYKPENRDETTL
ncbi:HD domain-containing protein [Leuconostoc falkenbergense]|uniref:HD domain-containing protein n=2 Tax=Leuconostoc falkenbergense TaxID=2766470 RepID=A0A9X3E8F8_9LACO|nr:MULTISPECIES: HD domain-containing protein [Leuconostoc]RDG20296.1 3'-5' exonuclease [Leuconostoc pseudomesenteroides]MCT4390013.1 HD domain-containing protein [Leuconostoc falkenbergense]MCX7579155.1 HD domain-containing protein [Leuconostoc falkenbergense]MDM7645819.1 HD domain-containing protein [Leuconostoc falkenbergense]MDV3546004.1 HD domain-containing protein [Leuconostoc falkenbergense]